MATESHPERKTPKEDDLAGTTLDDRFEVREVIGDGGMCVVYRAYDRLLRRCVAVKVLRKALATEPRHVHRFVREFNAAAIVHGSKRGAASELGWTRRRQPYHVMDMLDGESLRDMLRREGPLAPERAVTIAVEVCARLSEAHAKGVWHRDIKPENIVVSVDGDGSEHADILDYGVARLPGDAHSVVRARRVTGTAEYMSPERACGNQGDSRSDIYSLGCVLYEMLAGRPPFEEETTADTLRCHAVVRPAPLRRAEAAGGLPGGLSEVVMQSLEKRAADRPQTAGEFARALRSAVASRRERLLARVIGVRPSFLAALAVAAAGLVVNACL
jgi:serine/threonine-protein kinase